MVAEHLWNWQSSGNCNKNYVIGGVAAGCQSVIKHWYLLSLFSFTCSFPHISSFSCNSEDGIWDLAFKYFFYCYPYFLSKFFCNLLLFHLFLTPYYKYFCKNNQQEKDL